MAVKVHYFVWIKNLLSNAADMESLQGANEAKDPVWDKSSCRLFEM